MPFGRVGQGEFGTYFIGYARSPRTIEQMLENMFVGRPPGNYDRLLDFSRADHRHAVLRAVRDLPGERRRTTLPRPRRPSPTACHWRTRAGRPGARRLARHRLAQRRPPHEQSSSRACADLRRGVGTDRGGDHRARSSAISPRGASWTCRAGRHRARPPIGTGHLRNVAAPGRRHPGATARGQAAGRTARPVRARSPADRRRRARREGFGLAAGQGRRAAARLRRGPRDLRGLRRRRHRRHPPGHQQSGA